MPNKILDMQSFKTDGGSVEFALIINCSSNKLTRQTAADRKTGKQGNNVLLKTRKKEFIRSLEVKTQPSDRGHAMYTFYKVLFRFKYLQFKELALQRKRNSDPVCLSVQSWPPPHFPQLA